MICAIRGGVTVFIYTEIDIVLTAISVTSFQLTLEF